MGNKVIVILIVPIMTLLYFSIIMGTKIILSVISLIAFAISHANADHLHEVRILTSDCDGCGMAAFFGQISVKV